MKKLLGILICAVLLTALTAGSATAMEYFTISDYDISVSISESNAYDVTEVITVDFTEPRHGIYRSIPYQGTWLHEADEGGNTNWRAKITGISVDVYNYSVSRSSGYTVVKIGDADEYVDGTRIYRISYRIQFYDDGLSEADEVYYNLIGTDWDTTIDHVSFFRDAAKKLRSQYSGLFGRLLRQFGL